NWSGVDVDVCRAIAAAIFGDDKAVKYTPLSAKERFTALQSGEIDVLSRNTTWTATRDTALGLNFAGVNYYDGQGFMVRRDLGVNNGLELDGAAVCTNTGTTTELNVSDYFRANNMAYKVVAFEKADEVVAAYDSGRCDVYTTDQSGLYAQRIKLKDPAAHKVLPDVISKEPLGPVVRQGDDQWFNLVKWSLFCMVNAEEMGITSANVSSKASSGDPAINRLLGLEGSFGENLGVSPTWCKNIVSSVGNYGESFARNLSIDPLNIERGVNELWSKGGLQYAPPIR
ncbi:MAG: amino acid ABC transporter substrate-binding protein, partial [Gammaproteobacteria bacterium]